MARVSLEASPPSPETFSLSANPCHLYWGSCQRRGWRGAFKAKKKKKIHLSSLSQHHSISFCLFITRNSSSSGSLCIRHEGVRAIYFTVLYMLLI